MEIGGLLTLGGRPRLRFGGSSPGGTAPEVVGFAGGGFLRGRPGPRFTAVRFGKG